MTLYQGQSLYINRHKGLNNRSRSVPSTQNPPNCSDQFEPLTAMRCLNCDNLNHTTKQCKTPIDVTKTAKRKMEYCSKKNELRNQIKISDGESCVLGCLDSVEPEIADGDLFEPFFLTVEFGKTLLLRIQWQKSMSFAACSM